MVRKIIYILAIPVTVFSCGTVRQAALAQTLAIRTLEDNLSVRQPISSTHFSFAEPKDSVRYVLSVASENEYASTAAVYTDKILKDTTAFRLVNNQIRLPLVNGKYYTAKNKLSKDDSYLEYQYIGQLPAINKYVMACTGYEWHEYFTIDKQTGDTSVFFEQPKISPKNTRLACVYYDAYQTESQTIQVSTYRLNNKQVVGTHTTYIRIGDEQYPLACLLVWEDEQSMLVKLSFDKKSSQYLRIRLRK